MEILYPLIVGTVIVLGLYASGIPQRIGRLVGGPGRQERLLEAYASLARAALEARHAVDDAARRGRSPGQREHLQQSVTRLQLALKPVLEGSSGVAITPANEQSLRVPALDRTLLQRLQAAASEVQRGLHEAHALRGTEEERARVSAALHRVEEAMVPLAVDPLARGVARAAEAFYQDCAREAAAQDDPLGDLQSQLIGASYTGLYAAIQESSAHLLNGTVPPRHLAQR